MSLTKGKSDIIDSAYRGLQHALESRKDILVGSTKAEQDEDEEEGF